MWVGRGLWKLPRGSNTQLSPEVCTGVVLMKKQLKGSTAAAKSLQSCPTLCYPVDGSPPGFLVPGILQARTLEWVATSFSNACMHAKLIQSCPTLQPRRRRLTRLLCPQDCLGKKTGVGSHFLLQLFMLTEAKLHRRYCVLTVVFVCCWSRNEIPQTGWLKQQKFIFSQF